MFERGKIADLENYFLPLSKRTKNNVFVSRITATDGKVNDFIARYISSARSNGLLLDGGIKNPDTSNVQYCLNILGRDFKLAPAFFQSQIKTLLRLDYNKSKAIGDQLYDYFFEQSKTGKQPQNLMVNLYLKFMCWFYCKFTMMVSKLGQDSAPKVLVWDKTSKHELIFLDLISKLGADILYIFPKGDKVYLPLDKESAFSDLYTKPGLMPFDPNLTLRSVIENITFGGAIDVALKTNEKSVLNTWVQDNLFSYNSALTDFALRKPPEKGFANLFFLQYGVEDKYSYSSNLSDFYKKLVSKQRKILIINGEIQGATPDEVFSIERGNFNNVQQLVAALSKNITFPKRKDLEEMMKKAFAEVIYEDAKPSLNNMQKLNNIAVNIICWMKRILPDLLGSLKMPECAAFIYFSNKKPKIAEKIFFSLLAKLPVDVICFFPDAKEDYDISTKAKKVKFEDNLSIDSFPVQNGIIREMTFAGQAEQEISHVLRVDGSFVTQQYQKARVVTLNTSSYEVYSLWGQELRFRQGFSNTDSEVFIPTIFAKMNGVEGGKDKLNDYWLKMKELFTPETTVISKYPWVRSNIGKLMSGNATRYMDIRGKLLLRNIKNSSDYKYGYLDIDKQNYLLDKIQAFLDERSLSGMGKNGREYAVIGILLDLPQEILLKLQEFDFTKTNPKYIFIITNRYCFSFEETVVANFLHFLGFDVLIYTPTGFECFGPSLVKRDYKNFKLGQYLFNCEVPDFSTLERPSISRLVESIFRTKLW